MSHTLSDIRKTVEEQRAFFRSGTTLDVSWRLRQLRTLRDAVDEVLDVIEGREHPYREGKILPLLRLLEK